MNEYKQNKGQLKYTLSQACASLTIQQPQRTAGHSYQNDCDREIHRRDHQEE